MLSFVKNEPMCNAREELQPGVRCEQGLTNTRLLTSTVVQCMAHGWSAPDPQAGALCRPRL
jgi:hypothetical protein